jgi:hypothetical protein
MTVIKQTRIPADIIEEWYHIQTGKESPVSAADFKAPSEYLIKVFGDDKMLPELQRYHDSVKFDHETWIDIALGVLQFVPVTKWIGIAINVIRSVIWPVLKKRKN